MSSPSPSIRLMPSRTITAVSYANAGSYARMFGIDVASTWLCPSSCCRPSPFNVVRPAVAPQRNPRPLRVAERPDLIAGALHAEHRVEDVERQHLLAVGRVARARRGERRHRARFGDAFLEDLAVDSLAVRKKRLGVDRLVALPERRVDPDLLEQRVHAEGARLVGDDRHDALADVLVAQQIP